jgi:hypothetical protein
LALHAKSEEVKLNAKTITKKNVAISLIMLVFERIILLLEIYNAFVYRLL